MRNSDYSQNLKIKEKTKMKKNGVTLCVMLIVATGHKSLMFFSPSTFFTSSWDSLRHSQLGWDRKKMGKGKIRHE